MPIYEYECTHCHGKFDLLQKISDAPTTECKFCAHNTAVRLVSAAGFQLKGSGWYVTDFKNNNKDSKKESTSPKTKVENKSSEPSTKAESKPSSTTTTAKGESK